VIFEHPLLLVLVPVLALLLELALSATVLRRIP